MGDESDSSVQARIEGSPPHPPSPYTISDFYEPPSKRPKSSTEFSRGPETLENYISALHDSLLHHLLSFLPLDDAVKTHVLSKRWENLWTRVPNIIISLPHHSRDRLYDFVNFIWKTLALYKSPKVNKFLLEFDYDESYSFIIDSWVKFAMEHGVEDLHLDFYDASTHYSLPQFLYENSSLTNLSLRFCNIVPSGAISWNAKVSNDVVGTILSSSPVLEFLKLQKCHGFNRLDINSRNVKELVIDGCQDRSGRLKKPEVVIISAPYLRSLSILGFMWRQYVLMDVASLVEANLNFAMNTDDEDRVISCLEHQMLLHELLVKLRLVNKLSMGTGCLQVLSISKVEGLHSPLSKRKCLILDTEFEKWDILPGIASLLESSPDLEKLAINMTPSYSFKLELDKNFSKPFKYGGRKYWKSRNFWCLILHLKTVEIFGFNATCLGLMFMQFLLKKARALKKMVINTQGGDRAGWISLS